MLQQAGDVKPKAFHLFIFLEGKIQNLWKDEVGKQPHSFCFVCFVLSFCLEILKSTSCYSAN